MHVLNCGLVGISVVLDIAPSLSFPLLWARCRFCFSHSFHLFSFLLISFYVFDSSLLKAEDNSSFFLLLFIICPLHPNPLTLAYTLNVDNSIFLVPYSICSQFLSTSTSSSEKTTILFYFVSFFPILLHFLGL